MQPSLSYKVSNDATYGVGAILSRATMNTDSVQGNFTPSGVQDQDATFYGIGFQVGGVWQLAQTGSFALNVRSPVWHQKADNYNGGVFTDSIDTPTQVTAGFAFDPTASTTIAADFKLIRWSEANTIGNHPYANNTSAGFGWIDQKIIKLGVEHAVDEALTLRAGISHGNSPIQQATVTANFLFPAIIETHFTVGGSYDIGNGMVLGASGYVTPEAEFYDDGSLNANATGSHLAHQQYGFQLSFSNDF
ncbi:MAG: outer membrane protein transport protein [Magnetovibrio sp.]|nr:outer membrane protein transport protein [Magnetovibrio sp.]